MPRQGIRFGCQLMTHAQLIVIGPSLILTLVLVLILGGMVVVLLCEEEAVFFFSSRHVQALSISLFLMELVWFNKELDHCLLRWHLEF